MNQLQQRRDDLISEIRQLRVGLLRSAGRRLSALTRQQFENQMAQKQQELEQLTRQLEEAADVYAN